MRWPCSVGGTLVEAFGFKTIFYLPLALCHRATGADVVAGKTGHRQDIARMSAPAPAPPPDPHRPSPAKTRAFLRMAWLANPVAYIAINTFIPELPGRGGALSSLADVRGICLLAVGFRAVGNISDAVALDRLALPVPLAGDGVCHCSSFRSFHSHRAESARCCSWRKFSSAAPSG